MTRKVPSLEAVLPSEGIPVPAIGLAAAALLALGAPAQADDRLVFLAPDLARPDAEEVLNGLGPVLDDLLAGDGLAGFEAGTGRSLFEVRLPEDPLYDTHGGLRRNIFDPSLPGIVEAVRGIVERRDQALPVPAPGQIDMPRTLDAMALHAAPGTSAAVVGNVLYNSPDLPDYSMIQAYPTDGHFARSRSVTPFGGQGYENSLDGMTIHVCVTDTAWVNPAHQAGVQRVYARMIAQRGAMMATFSTDLAGCMQRFAQGRTDGARDFSNEPQDDRVAMIDPTKPVEVPVVAVRPPPPRLAAPVRPTALQEELDLGVTEMRELTFWDTDVEDGDVVRIVGTDFEMTVNLTNAPQTIEVPVKLGVLELVGVFSGQGDITVGVRTEDGTELVRGGIQPGQSVGIDLGNV